MMIMDELLAGLVQEPRFEAAVEEIVTHPMSEFATLEVSLSGDVESSRGVRRLRISVELIDPERKEDEKETDQ